MHECTQDNPKGQLICLIPIVPYLTLHDVLLFKKIENQNQIFSVNDNRHVSRHQSMFRAHNLEFHKANMKPIKSITKLSSLNS